MMAMERAGTTESDVTTELIILQLNRKCRIMIESR